MYINSYYNLEKIYWSYNSISTRWECPPKQNQHGKLLIIVCLCNTPSFEPCIKQCIFLIYERPKYPKNWKRRVCLGNVMFWSLLIINTSLYARQTRTRVIVGYDSTREGASGDKYLFYILFNHNYLVERIGYMIFLRKAMWFLICK